MDDFKEKLTQHYNKFNEDKRLGRRHGQVEFNTSIFYLNKYIKPSQKIVDIGAGTGKYSIYLKNLGYDVTAVEYLRPNIGKLKVNDPSLKVVEASATDLSMFKDNEFDVAIMFGPMYHLFSKEDKLKALIEAKRITKGIIFIAYLMNEYCVIEHAFKDNNYKDIKDKLNDDFHINDPDNLYFQVRIEDINELNQLAGLHSIERFSQEGPSDYIRDTINAMDDETFDAYMKFVLVNSNRKELLGAGSHVVDIVSK